jgi:hypothetical protein
MLTDRWKQELINITNVVGGQMTECETSRLDYTSMANDASTLDVNVYHAHENKREMNYS